MEPSSRIPSGPAVGDRINRPDTRLHRHSDHAKTFSASCIGYEALLVQEYLNCVPDVGAYNFNGVTWSISVEMGMYVVALPLLMSVARWGLGWLLSACGAAIALGILMLPVHAGSIYTWTYLPTLVRGAAGFSFGFAAFRARGLLPRVAGLGAMVPAAWTLVFLEMLLAAPQVILLASLAALALLAIATDTHGQVNPLVNRLYPLGQLT